MLGRPGWVGLGWLGLVGCWCWRWCWGTASKPASQSADQPAGWPASRTAWRPVSARLEPTLKWPLCAGRPGSFWPDGAQLGVGCGASELSRPFRSPGSRRTTGSFVWKFVAELERRPQNDKSRLCCRRLRSRTRRSSWRSFALARPSIARWATSAIRRAGILARPRSQAPRRSIYIRSNNNNNNGQHSSRGRGWALSAVSWSQEFGPSENEEVDLKGKSQIAGRRAPFLLTRAGRSSLDSTLALSARQSLPLAWAGHTCTTSTASQHPSPNPNDPRQSI